MTRNPFFVGREELLQEMREALERDHVVAINGQAGIGKTEMAHAYAERYSDSYQPILWLNGSTYATLLTTLFAQLQQIELSMPPIQTRPPLIQALRNWLIAQQGYLSILDNAGDPSIVQALFPARPAGHLLLLADQQVAENSTGFLAIDSLAQKEGAHLLLTRARMIPPTTSLDQVSAEQRAAALELARELNGHPLALELAAAYIKETGCTIQEYLQHYYQSRTGESSQTEPLETTWQISYASIHTASPFAAELLHKCAFFAPDDIPLELVLNDTIELEAATALTEPSEKVNAEYDKMREVLFAYALFKPGAFPHTANFHQALQDILLNTLSQDERRTWTTWMVQALYRRLPPISGETLGDCLRYVPHVQRLADLSEQEVDSFQEEAAQLFSWAATVLAEFSVYQDAVSLLSKSLAIWQRLLGEEHPTTITALHNLASLYEKQGAYTQAEELFRRVLALRRKMWGENHTETVISLNNLAHVYAVQKKFEEAETLYRRALHVCTNTLGPESPATIPVLYNLASLYGSQGEFAQAEVLLDGAYSIRKHLLGPEHIDTVKILHRLALLYMIQGRWKEAEKAYRKVLPIYQRDLGWAHPDTTGSYMEMANLFLLLGKIQQAEGMQEQLLEMREQALGQEHPDTLASMNALAGVHLTQKNYQQATDLLQRTLAISKETPGPAHTTTAVILSMLALTYECQGEHEQAMLFLQEAFNLQN